MGLSDCALRTISGSALTIHKSAQLVSNLGVTIFAKSGTDTVGKIDTDQESEATKSTISGVVTEGNMRS
jgi:hypothetical protein